MGWFTCIAWRQEERWFRHGWVEGFSVISRTDHQNAMGFLLTTALFTQHLWTLAIAIATFCLLKYPLSRATRYLDQFSWACWPVIWGVSALHSGRMSLLICSRGGS
jgi:hypothetical protein